MELLPNNIIREDVWSYLQDDQTLDHSQSFVICPWKRLSEKDLELFSKNTERGVSIVNDIDVEVLSDYLSDKAIFTLVDLEFPSFNDGRAFSQAKKLRSELGFKKTVRAHGHILPDQATFLMRCGVDSIIIDTERFNPEIWKESIKSFSYSYQREEPLEVLGSNLPSSAIAKRLSSKPKTRA